MLISELYGADFFKTNRYSPKFDTFVLQNFEKASQVVQAQNFVPIGQNLGDGTLGKVFEVETSEGGLSPNRDYYQDIEANVIGTTKKTVFMSNNAEVVKVDKNQQRVHGSTERDRQLNLALARLNKTFVYKLFNADTTLIDETDKINNESTTKKYDYDGWKRFFTVNTAQVENTPLMIGDVINNVNLKLEANQFLNEINSRVDVNGLDAEVIYTTRRGKNILVSLDTHKVNYVGEYKFTRAVNTWEGIPIIEIPDSLVPETWKAKGEFVLFANQDQEAGARIMVPANGGLIVSHEPSNNRFVSETPLDMTFAPILINSKAGALCYISMDKTEVGEG